MIDLLSIRNEEFYKVLATEAMKTTSGKTTEWIESGKQF